jgi:endonuclease-3
MEQSRAAAVVDRLWELYGRRESPFPPENIGVDVSDPERGGDGAALDSAARQPPEGRRDAFECLVRTILSQNTADAASHPAHEDLMARYGPDRGPDPDGETEAEAETEAGTAAADRGDLAANLAAASVANLAETIASAGLYNQKAERIVAIAGRVVEEYGGAAGFDAFVGAKSPERVREALLDFTGVGPKTADCVLLFAGGREGVFPVDTHVHRIYRRIGAAPPDADHETVRTALETQVPAEDCGFGHTASIQFGREYCTARKPACLDGLDACPLSGLCDRVGVDPDAGEAVDPAETS